MSLDIKEALEKAEQALRIGEKEYARSLLEVILTIDPNNKQALWLYRKHWKRLEIRRRHREDILAVAWSPDGRYIASGSKDRTI